MFYRSVLSPLLNRLDSEQMHTVAREALRLAEQSQLGREIVHLSAGSRVVSPLLHVSFSGLRFENPVIVAAGWDKDGRSVRGLYEMGFSGVEIGSVLEYPQPGNPKPRQFMIGPGVALNSLGFNSGGMEVVSENLKRYAADTPVIPLGVNIGKNKETSEEDSPRSFAAVARKLYREASYFVINVSSPNTPGLRKLQDRGLLTAIVEAVFAAQDECGARKPTFVKIAPELTPEAVDEVIAVALEQGLSGILATNTTNNPDIKGKYGASWRERAGGLSGDDTQYRALATERVRQIYRSAGDRLSVIGLGGVKDATTALEKILAGASAVQVMTAIRGEGPRVVSKINQGILNWMMQNQIESLSSVVGKEQELGETLLSLSPNRREAA